MMMLAVIMVQMVAAVSAAFGLEGARHPYESRSEAVEHLLDHMVGPDAKNLVPDFSRQMPISQVPGKAYELAGVFMPDLDDCFRRGLNPEPSPIFKLQAISIGHGDRVGKVENDVFTVIRSQANATAMSLVKVESERAHRLFLRPMAGGSMMEGTTYGEAMH